MAIMIHTAVINLLPFHFRNVYVTAVFTSETEIIVRRFQKRNRHLDPEVFLNIRFDF